MKFNYNGVDITDQVDIIQATSWDPAGNISDRCEVELSDTSGIWHEWNPQKGDTIEVSLGGYSTGPMNIDQLEAELHSIFLGSISLKPEAKTKSTKAWEKSKFKQIASDLVSKAGMKCDFIGITDYLYERVDQVDEEPLVLLDRLCIREGYRMKITKGIIYIYDERTFESSAPVKVFEKHEITRLSYKDKSSGLFNSCIVSSIDLSGIKATFTPPDALMGSVLKIKEAVSSVEEAMRFAKNYLRHANKYEKNALVDVPYTPGIAGGNTFELNGCGVTDGKYFVEEAKHAFSDTATILTARKILGGY